MNTPAHWPPGGRTSLHAIVHGRVQGVGFRWATHERLTDLGLRGTAVNREDGTVEVNASGAPQALADLAEWLRGGTTPGEVTRVEIES